MTNSFCSMLSNGLHLSDKGFSTKQMVYRPCCHFKEESTISNRESWNNISDWVKQCQLCKDSEINNKNQSLRLFSNHLQPASVNKIIHLELDYGNACNSACGMCLPIYSSKIAKIMREEKINNVDVPKVKRTEFIDVVESLDLSQLQYLKFRGGEPLYLDFHKKIISMIDNRKNVSLFYQTNGSIYPDDEWWDLVKDFKSIHFSFSIDAVGEKFNFIRAGLDWKEVDFVIKKLIANTNKITGDIRCTYSPLNLFYHDELFRYYLELRKINKSLNFGWHPAMAHWDIKNTTPALREIVNRKYKNIFSNALKENPFQKENHEKFVENLLLHEKRFNYVGKNIFPDIWDIAIKI